MLCLIAGLFGVIDRNKILKQKYVKINETLTQQIVENKNYQLRIKQLYQMDTQRLQELASAKSEINRLRSYAERDPERVYIRASCATNDANSTPAWMMQPAPDLLTPLSEIIGYSEKELLSQSPSS